MLIDLRQAPTPVSFYDDMSMPVLQSKGKSRKESEILTGTSYKKKLANKKIFKKTKSKRKLNYQKKKTT